MHTALIIPARFGSTRLPGKPLIKIKGQSLLERVLKLSEAAIQGLDAAVFVATDDLRIKTHAESLGAKVLMTSAHAKTGTDRVAEALKLLAESPKLVINMQGDAPLTPPDFIRALIEGFDETICDAVTAVTQLSWEALDQLRANKVQTPFSGTTALFNQETGLAYWFSKQILPALRKEDMLRKENSLSPVFRHIGLYGYTPALLESFVQLAESPYEALEGLEQLRILEQGYRMRCLEVEYKGRASMSGVDSPEDILRAEALIEKHGELL